MSNATQPGATSEGPRRDTALSWSRDLTRSATVALVVNLIITVILFVADQWGVRLRPTADRVVEATPELAGMFAAGGAVGWAFFFIEGRHGIRYRNGLPAALVVLTVPVAVLVELVIMSGWPILIGDGGSTDGVAGQVVTDPASLVLVGSLLCAMHAWTATSALGLFHGSIVANLLGALGIVVAPFVAVLAGLTTFSNPASAVGFLIWWILAATGLVALALAATVMARHAPRP